ncbi:MAG: S1 RNA-binding domain-containing protein [Firmicutes bacterium]|nr:S1 RNA-binding domain-containing protein [Bacillota bacterium]
MSLEIGSEVEGVVTGIAHFGAFVKLPDGNAGLIHISELADAYVEDIRQFINEKDKVIVKVLGKNNKGKYDLSLKQVEQNQAAQKEKIQQTAAAQEVKEPGEQREPRLVREQREPREQRDFRDQKETAEPREFREYREERKPREERYHHSFEDKISRFLKESEEKLLDLKRNTEAKRGKGRGR